MCGIVGFIDKEYDYTEKKKTIESMSEKIKHRGPDSVGYYIDENIALSHRRLAIIDVTCKESLIYNENI